MGQSKAAGDCDKEEDKSVSGVQGDEEVTTESMEVGDELINLLVFRPCRLR